MAAAVGAAGAAQAESPTVCYGHPLEDWVVNHANTLPNGFVEYSSYTKDGVISRLYLEHCASGQVMQVQFDNDWRNPSTIVDHFYDRLEGAQGVSQKQLAVELADLGGDTRLTKSTQESCGCKAFHPEARGTKAPYEATP
ncbi:hypothetical protein [uncultured Litoreibacter sp.]|uniref:hypothetical protein n=1 Tax=uncultured Litoreibacter sp. TaxID=1392394 RepID=UPI002622E724|nr:hypothetical protein [uncultured Litoreibacter sp.]